MYSINSVNSSGLITYSLFVIIGRIWVTYSWQNIWKLYSYFLYGRFQYFIIRFRCAVRLIFVNNYPINTHENRLYYIQCQVRDNLSVIYIFVWVEGEYPYMYIPYICRHVLMLAAYSLRRDWVLCILLSTQ